MTTAGARPPSRICRWCDISVEVERKAFGSKVQPNVPNASVVFRLRGLRGQAAHGRECERLFKWEQFCCNVLRTSNGTISRWYESAWVHHGKWQW